MNERPTYMNVTEDHISANSRKELAAGVLEQAKHDLRRFYGAASAVERELYLDAYSWLTSDDSSWPFSFLNVCQLLNLTPEVAREELLADAPLSFFSYLSRRCGRAARSFRVFFGRAFTNQERSTAVDPVPLTHAA